MYSPVVEIVFGISLFSPILSSVHGTTLNLSIESVQLFFPIFDLPPSPLNVTFHYFSVMANAFLTFAVAVVAPPMLS